MRISFLLGDLEFSGGRLVLFDYAAALMEHGHQVEILVAREKGSLVERNLHRVVGHFSHKTVPESDLLVASHWRDVADAVACRRGPVVHFCQGYEIAVYEQRLQGEGLPADCQGDSLRAMLRLRSRRFTWKRRISRIDSVYRLDTRLVTVSPHIQKMLTERYKRSVRLCPNGVRADMFHPSGRTPPLRFAPERPFRIILIGPSSHRVKDVKTALGAIRLLKDAKRPVSLVRITPDKPTPMETSLCDEIHVSLERAEMADIYRGCDAFISSSLEGEGFGLPVIEAMNCGLPCVLSDISSYRSLAGGSLFSRMFAPGDSAAAAAGLAEIMDSTQEERISMEKAAHIAGSDYSFSRAADKFEKILQEFVSEQKK